MQERAGQFITTTRMLSFAENELALISDKCKFDFGKDILQIEDEDTMWVLTAENGIEIIKYVHCILYRKEATIPECLAPVVIDGKIDTNILTNITSTFINIAMVNRANRKSISPKNTQLPTMEDIKFVIFNALEIFQEDISG